ncbi:MAG: hypothetical protein WDO69_25130 [Pseudomonadota bacterium]
MNDEGKAGSLFAPSDAAAVHRCLQGQQLGERLADALLSSPLPAEDVLEMIFHAAYIWARDGMEIPEHLIEASLLILLNKALQTGAGQKR